MLSLRSLILLLFTLFFCLDLATAARYPIQPRADSSSPALTDKLPSLSSITLSSSAAQSDGASTSQAPSSSESTSATLSSTTSDASVSSAPTSTPPVTSALTTSASGAPVPTTSTYNVTLTPDSLPINPQLTPAFGFAGVLLILSGSVYTLVGLRNKWIHIFLSAAYLISLAVTVLIIYVMNLPVSDGIQGAYVAAITLTGLILGSAALLVREMTEGLGCLFGGFCLAMWLLVLKPGGLLTGTAPIVIFIVCFALVGWALSFSKFTRPYGLIVLLSFGGATVLVLGIDCFSRAGLKEFWAYIWNLNTNLFPLGATTYPLTRGMKVEIAAIIIIFLIGMTSQTKLWKIIKKQRERRALDKLPHEINFRREEELIGRRIENATARQKVYWEAVYGNKSSAPSADSGIGSQHGGGDSTTPSTRHSEQEGIEMNQISNAPAVTRNAPEMGPIAQPSFVVRVVADDDITSESPNEPGQGDPDKNRLSYQSNPHPTTNSHRGSADRAAMTVISDEETELLVSRHDSKASSRRASGPPDVIPLPFKVSVDEGDDKSSLATIADDDKSHRLSARLSRTSDLLRSLSHKSRLRPDRLSQALSTSTEHLVQPDDADDGRSSRAATVDDLSDDDSIRRFVEESPERPPSDEEPNLEPEPEPNGKRDGPQFTKATLGWDKEISPVLSSHPNMKATGCGTSTDQPMVAQGSDGEKIEDDDELRKMRPSSETADDHIPAALTEAALPPALPRVASSYRTNEWAKHLSNADAPEIEAIRVAEGPAREKPVFVNVEELQQTPETAQVPPAPRSASRSSNHPLPAPITHRSSYQSIQASRNLPMGTPLTMTVSPSASQQSLQRPTLQSMQGMRSYRSSSGPYMGQALVESPIEGVPQEFPPSTTLLDQRDSIIRNKSALGYHVSESTPALVSRRTSETRLSTIYDPGLDDDNVSLSARRSALRQSSLTMNPPPMAQKSPFDSHQPRRQSSTPVNSAAKEAQMAQWRASIQQDLEAKVQPKRTMEKSRSALLQERMSVERQRDMEQAMKGARDNAIDERMRKGDMLEAHKDAMRKMQREANRKL